MEYFNENAVYNYCDLYGKEPDYNEYLTYDDMWEFHKPLSPEYITCLKMYEKYQSLR